MLKDEKVRHLAEKVAKKLMEFDEVELVDDKQSLVHNISEAIFDNLDAEDALEDEVREMLDEALRGQSRDSVNYSDLFKKAKQKLARERGIVL